MNDFEKLIRHFERFPGIGPRQARRFAHHLLRIPQEDSIELATLISHLQETVTPCESCLRFFARKGSETLCSICNDQGRDKTKLLIVAHDNDIGPIERASVYDGLYFVLGGLVPLIESKSTHHIHGRELTRVVNQRLANDGLHEIVLAFSVNPDGENTARYIQKILRDLLDANDITLSTLGRGLSTGSELEYADSETIKSALQNRH